MKQIKSLFLVLILGVFFTNGIYAQDKVEKTASGIEKLVVKVKGVGCSGDANRILANVEKKEGVNSCKIVKEGAVTKYEVTYYPTIITKKEIYAAIEKTDGCANQADNPYTVKGK